MADRLGEKPTKLYHHVDTLEAAGLIKLVKTKRKRGTVEKYFEAVAERFVQQGTPRMFGSMYRGIAAP